MFVASSVDCWPNSFTPSCWSTEYEDGAGRAEARNDCASSEGWDVGEPTGAGQLRCLQMAGIARPSMTVTIIVTDTRNAADSGGSVVFSNVAADEHANIKTNLALMHMAESIYGVLYSVSGATRKRNIKHILYNMSLSRYTNCTPCTEKLARKPRS